MPESTREVLVGMLVEAFGYHRLACLAADAILTEFLVVPRSDIVGTEYGYEQYRRDLTGWHVTKTRDRDAAIAAARREHYDDDCEGRPRTRPVSRPIVVPPWSPIPLPEDGDTQ